MLPNKQDVLMARQIQETTMSSAGYFTKMTNTKNSFGVNIETQAENILVKCRISFQTGKELRRQDQTIFVYDASLLVPLKTKRDVTIGDGFVLVEMFNERMEDELVFEIVSPPQIGATGVRYLLKIVEN